MKKELLSYLVCPKTSSILKLKEGFIEDDNEIIAGVLVNKFGDEYKIDNTLPDMIYDEEFVGDSKFARNYYTKISDTYDENLHVTFDLYNEKEEDIREYMITLLNLNPNSKVLEVSAGTGKDSELILKKLGANGTLTALDITPAMLIKAKENLQDESKRVDFVAGTACSLPFADNSFDALYCFAGVGHFPNVKKALKEMARVVKVGGKVVFCEKNVPLWLKDTEYGKILINNNPMFGYDAPLKDIPIEARNLGIRWILGNVHYVVDYTVGEGVPKGNFDLVLPGERGGTFNTRYYGKLEGVSLDVKELALKAREKSGMSMHEWLENAIKHEAQKTLGE